MHSSLSPALRSLAFSVAFTSGGLAFAQSCNIDIGGVFADVPAVAYGAGAHQVGAWNFADAAVGLHGVAQPIFGLGGAGGGFFGAITIGGGNGSFSFNNAGTLGDDQVLMDDLHDIGGVGSVATYSFAGLAPGGYWVYTYAWAPDNATFITKVSVGGSGDPDQKIGGAWLAGVGQQYTRTFAKHFVDYLGGAALVVTCTTDAGSGSVNGIQLVFGGAFGCDGRFDTYCTAKVNSAGCLPAIQHGGPNPPSAGVFVNGFLIGSTNILPNKPGLLFYSTSGPNAVPFQGGTLCIKPPIRRTPVVNSGGTLPCGGSLSMDFNAFIATGADALLQVPGQGVWCQWWSRDPGFAAPNNTNLTDALNFTICF